MPVLRLLPLPMPANPTQLDIARFAGVSQATVSIVLNGAGNTHVPEATRQKVLEAAKALSYVPNRVAQNLRNQKTLTLACVVPDITNPFYPALERGAQNAADRIGYDLLIYNTDGSADRERKCLQMLLQGRVDGILGVFFNVTAGEFQPFFERKIAVVRIEATRKQTGSWPLDNIFVDNTAAASAATKFLIDSGHARIAMLAGSSGPHSARVAGYLQALEAAALEPTIVSGKSFSEAQGYQSMKRLIASKSRPSAVFAANDVMAIGALVAIRDAGLQVPKDIAVIGFDNIPLARLVSPSLTTVSQFQHKLGERAVAMLYERITNRIQGSGRCEEMRFNLVVREST
jgi:LacI family transcriptional regulator